MASTILEALYESTELTEINKPDRYAPDAKPDCLLAHFTDSLTQLKSIISSGSLKPLYGHNYISFEDKQKISIRYSMQNLIKQQPRLDSTQPKNKYKFGLVFNTDALSKTLSDQQYSLTPYHDIFEKINGTKGVYVTGLIKCKDNKGFFMVPRSEDYRTIVHIDNNSLFDSIEKLIGIVNQYGLGSILKSRVKATFVNREPFNKCQNLPDNISKKIDAYNATYKTDFVVDSDHCYISEDRYSWLRLCGDKDQAKITYLWFSYPKIKKLREPIDAIIKAEDKKRIANWDDSYYFSPRETTINDFPRLKNDIAKFNSAIDAMPAFVTKDKNYKIKPAFNKSEITLSDISRAFNAMDSELFENKYVPYTIITTSDVKSQSYAYAKAINDGDFDEAEWRVANIKDLKHGVRINVEDDLLGLVLPKQYKQYIEKTDNGYHVINTTNNRQLKLLARVIRSIPQSVEIEYIDNIKTSDDVDIDTLTNYTEPK